MANLHAESVNNVPILTVEGRLDTLSSPDLDKAIAPLLAQENHLVINFSKCTYLSSSGLRSLISISKKIGSRENGQFVLADVSVEVAHVLEMAGLQSMFTVARSLEEAIELVLSAMEISRPIQEIEAGNWLFDHHVVAEHIEPALIWKDRGIASYDELGFSLGKGMPAETTAADAQHAGLFFTTRKCAGFIPYDTSSAPDFRISMEPSRAGIFVEEAISFSKQPNAMLQLKNTRKISWHDMITAIREVSLKTHSDIAVTGFVLADQHPETPSISVGLISEPGLLTSPMAKSIPFIAVNDDEEGQPGFLGSSFMLDKLYKQSQAPLLDVFLDDNIRLENITDFSAVDKKSTLTQPILWLFLTNSAENAATQRIQIEAPGDFLSSPKKAFLTRRLYQDSSTLILKQLQGGFSAQTYQVTSYDRDGRKLRPTVLKLADRQMITREASRCQEYAMPYILNNSAIILGTEFFGNTGALRYNFVGIGGEQSKLKWLTHYFLEWPAEKLKPLFDKIFLEILNPWYGQTVKQAIYPFRDHDPTKTFFPDIFDKAASLFGISADEQMIYLEETGREMINPYWFLKHTYPKQYGMAMDYPTAICHGDLNMQNILLDEQMNVYLIDFSETRPRSVVSDFARLEAVFMLEFSPLDSAEDLSNMVRIISILHNTDQLNQFPEVPGVQNEAIKRNLHLSGLMRKYAFTSSGNNPDPVPYTIALLEWVLPVVNYVQANNTQKRLSMVIASLLCEKLTKWLF